MLIRAKNLRTKINNNLFDINIPTFFVCFCISIVIILMTKHVFRRCEFHRINVTLSPVEDIFLSCTYFFLQYQGPEKTSSNAQYTSTAQMRVYLFRCYNSIEKCILLKNLGFDNRRFFKLPLVVYFFDNTFFSKATFATNWCPDFICDIYLYHWILVLKIHVCWKLGMK